jgi:hypothetical protein
MSAEESAYSLSDPRVPERTGARRTWLARMINEHGSAPVFDGLARQLEAAGVAMDLVAACRTMAAEERTHGALCGAVVEALGGDARAEADPPRPLPGHRAAWEARRSRRAA